MKVIYVHHAMRDKGNPPTQEDGITELGYKDAEVVGQILAEDQAKGVGIKAIYSSTFFRCLETARIINKIIQVPVLEEDRFNEFGSVHYAVKGLSDPNSKETWVQCQERIRSAIKDIVYKYDGDDAVVCVTSGVNIAPFISLAYGMPSREDVPFLNIPSCSPIIFDINKNMFEV